MAKKSVSDQMELFDDGGFRDQGNTTDPVSNNPVPVGSTQEEVRDDIPANLSEGEFVLPADVVRYHGLEKIMGIRDQAKSGLQKMESMGQMGNSDQATMPDGVPFKQMAVGGVVPPTVQQPQVVTQNQVPGVQYVAPTTQAIRPSVYQQPQQVPQVNVPTQPIVNVPTAPNYQTPAYRQPTNTAATPKFSNLLGTQFGQLQESVTKKYVNSETGEEMYIPFVNGEPVYPIPTGFIEESEVAKKAQDEDINKAVRSTSVRQEQDSENPVNANENTREYRVASELMAAEGRAKGSFGSKVEDTLSKVFTTGVLGQVVEFLQTPEQRASQGPISDMYGDDFITDPNQKEINAKRFLGQSLSTPINKQGQPEERTGITALQELTNIYGVEPSFKFGTKPGDVSRATGKIYNFAGQSKATDGTIAYTGWDAWTDDLSDSYDTGWGGGFTSEADIQAAITANDKRADRGIAGYTHSRDGGWDRSKVDAYNALKAEKAGGYIDEKGNFAKGKKTDSNNIVDITKGKAKAPTKENLAFRQPSDTYTPPPKAPPAAVSLTATGADSTSGDETDTSPQGSGLSDSSSSFDTSSYTNNDSGDGDSSYGDSTGADVGGWTAKGGFINKRTMTMSKVSPNKKKRGGLASRK